MDHSQGDDTEEMLIGDFARAVGSTKDTVRFYTRLGLLDAGQRAAGQRHYAVYDQDQVDRFVFIEQCKALGFTLQEIGSGFKEHEAGTLTAERQQEILEAKLRSIEERIETLRRAAGKLRAKVEPPSE